MSSSHLLGGMVYVDKVEDRKVQHIRVSSSNILSVGFDPEANILEINFHGGRVYQYLNVPKEVFDALVSSASKGTFFNQRIKDKYRTVRIV